MTGIASSADTTPLAQAPRDLLPALPPPPPDQNRVMLASTTQPTGRGGTMQRSLFASMPGSVGHSAANSTCLAGYNNSEHSALVNATATTAMGSNFFASSFGSILTEADPSSGPLLRHIPRSSQTPVQTPTVSTLHSDEKQLATQQTAGASDANSSTRSRLSSTPAAMERRPSRYADAHAAQTPPPAGSGLSAGPAGSAPVSRSSALATASADKDTLDVPVRQFVRRTFVSSSSRQSSASLRSSATPVGAASGSTTPPPPQRALPAAPDATAAASETSSTNERLAGTASTRAGTSVLPPHPTAAADEVDQRYDDVDAAAAPVSPLAEADAPIRETFAIPRYCPDDLLRGEDKMWVPGKPLRIAYVSWNMASKEPRTSEVSAYCIHPNAHLVVVGTQENGPYVVSNKQQRRWTKMITDVCLGGQYELVGKHHMWAVQMLVFARGRDVAKYVSRAHASHVKTGLLNGLGGNKGGVAVGLVLSLTPKDIEASPAGTTHRAATTTTGVRSPPPEREASLSGLPAPCLRSTALPTLAGATVDAARSEAVLTSSVAAGEAPPPLLSATHMQFDADDEALYPRSVPLSGSAVDLNGNEDDAVFSPAELLDRNASFDLSRERAAAHTAPHAQHEHRRHHHHHHHHTDQRNGIASTDNKETAKATGSARRRRSDDETEETSHGTPDMGTPNYMTLLFITAHLAAHQGAVRNRNKDYRQIVHGLDLGRRGPYRKFFKQLLRRKHVLAGEEVSDDDDAADVGDHWEDDSSEEDVMPLSLPIVSRAAKTRKARRDVTDEFDLTFFGGDLNYRINGTRKAIEYVIQHHRHIRAILINNDQLSLERARGTVFQGFQEGNLLFRPTYKYEVSAGGGVTLDAYNFSHKKNRMPAYCDRILYKKKLSSAARRIAIRIYTDVPNVRSSDHRPVVALLDVGTRAYTG